MTKIAKIKKAVSSFVGRAFSKTGIPQAIKTATKIALRNDRLFLATFIATFPTPVVLPPFIIYFIMEVDFSQRWMFTALNIGKAIFFLITLVIAVESKYHDLKRIHKRWSRQRRKPST